MDIRGYIAKFLVTDKVYFPMVEISNGRRKRRFFMYASKDPEIFYLCPYDGLKNQIFLYLCIYINYI